MLPASEAVVLDINMSWLVLGFASTTLNLCGVAVLASALLLAALPRLSAVAWPLDVGPDFLGLDFLLELCPIGGDAGT